ncbi:MAG: sulfatase [Verrucomicrobiales bacterium]|nr:sulfatase [Verrucomicrobiales bacterium]
MRRFLFICFLALITCPAVVPAGDRPHLFVYLSDDHSYFDTSLYGATDIPMPEMERLAADGISFTHAFVASPACAPSRAAMLTGLMPARNGAEANHTYPAEGTHFLIEDLKAAGYRVAAFGKVAHAKDLEPYGFDYSSPAREHALLLQEVNEFIEREGSDSPLCLFVGTSNPHVPWPLKNTFDPSEVEIPGVHLDTPETRKLRAAYYQEISDLDTLLGDLREIAAEELGDNTVFVHTSDHGSQWPFGKWNLYDYGIRVPLLVSWPGVIEAGVRTDAMVSWIDLLPTLMDLAGGAPRPGIDGESFLGVLTGEEKSHRDTIFTTHSGDGEMNVFPIRAIRTGDWKLIHNLRPDLAHTNHSDVLRKRSAGSYWNEWAALAKEEAEAQAVLERYFQRPEFELYHVSVDPWETENLIDLPSQQDRVERLKERLLDWMTSQGDTGEIFDEPRPLAKPERWHPDFFKKPAAFKKKKSKGE